MRFTDIVKAIIFFEREKVRELIEWSKDYYNRHWDRQIEGDLVSGKLDSILAEVDAEIDFGSAKPQ